MSGRVKYLGDVGRFLLAPLPEDVARTAQAHGVAESAAARLYRMGGAFLYRPVVLRAPVRLPSRMRYNVIPGVRALRYISDKDDPLTRHPDDRVADPAGAVGVPKVFRHGHSRPYPTWAYAHMVYEEDGDPAPRALSIFGRLLGLETADGAWSFDGANVLLGFDDTLRCLHGLDLDRRVALRCSGGLMAVRPEGVHR